EELVRKNYKDGKYKQITNLPDYTNRLTEDLQSISHDKHLRIRTLPPRSGGEQVKISPEEARKQRLEQLRKDNFGFKKMEILPGNIGYIDFRYFSDAGFGQAGATAIAAMNFLAYTDAIIFDLRQNGGGSPSMIQLISSYLFEESVHLNSFYIRKTNETKQFWTQGHVQGPKMAKTPVYVLTSSYTFSGAEEFTYNLKNMKRGTIIGETTGGGAHPVEGHIFEDLKVGMSLPFGRAVNPITKTNWEGTGIEPDIKVAADQALMVARIEATKKLMEMASDETKKKQLAWAIAGLEAEKNPVKMDEKALQVYVGTYSPRKIWLENGTLFYQRENRPKYKLVPMGDHTFIVEGLDYFRIKFNQDETGKVIELVGMYDNGETDSNKRN
ncbi:S41 family peptidase, partial [candidate division KSB1 bacterium]|nr:S41 family peptidase [candidate division KSB1 bacterium]